MIVGHSAGVMAALASASTSGDVHDIDLAELHAKLLNDEQILEARGPSQGLRKRE